MTSTGEHYLDVPLQAMQSYLRGAGWSLLDRDDRTSLWAPAIDARAPADTAPIRLVLPLSEEINDYPERVEQALRALSYVERRVPREILDDIVYGAADTISVRLTPEAPSGEAPLALAHAAIGALRNYIVGAASSLEIKGLVLPPRRPVRAEAYAREARLSTASGSFVLNLALPLGEPNARPAETNGDGALFDLPPLPYGRRVTDRMIDVARRSTALARRVGEGDEGIEAFARPDRSTANATELAALASIGANGDEHARYHLRFAHSPLAPIAGSTAGELIAVTPAEQRVLGDAAEFLRSKQPRAGVTVSGLVVRLARAGKLGPGDVVVQGIDDDSGAQRRFRMNLGEDDYSRAIRAHEYGLRVSAVGNVELRGSQRHLSQVTSFDVVEGLYDEA